MTDINLKTLTPDTSLPTTGFLFGADSQASTNPSVYSTQTVATTLLGSTSLTGATLTASAPVLNLTQTWNSSGVTFTGMAFNAAGTSDANSATASLLMDLQVNTTSKFSVTKQGYLRLIAGSAQNPSLSLGTTTNTGFYSPSVGTWTFTANNGDYASFGNGNGVTIAANVYFAFSNTSGNSNGTQDTFISRKAAANLRFGAADAASPVAQTLSVQSIVGGLSGTPNLSAAAYPFTITGAQGTGTGAGGSIIFQVAPAGGSGTAQNALVAALTIDSTKAATFANVINCTGVTSSGDVYASRQIGLGYTNAFLYAPTAGTLGIYNGSSGAGGFAFIQGKLKTDNAYTAGVLVPTGYITLYDSTGTAYRVPCLV